MKPFIKYEAYESQFITTYFIQWLPLVVVYIQKIFKK